MSLRSVLRRFTRDAFDLLQSIGELPRPPGNAPIIAGDDVLTHQLSSLPSHASLRDYLHVSGINQRLQDVGHQWLWHREVFEWLFLERVIAATRGGAFDQRAFELVLRRAEAEVSRPTARIRRVTVLEGIASPLHEVQLGRGVRLAPLSFETAHYRLADLFHVRFQDANRFPSTGIFASGPILIQDRVIAKGHEGRELLDYLTERRQEADRAILALRLAVDTPVFPKHIYTAYLSAFPLLTVSHQELPEFASMSWDIRRHLTRTQVLDMTQKFQFANSVLHHGSSAPAQLTSSLIKFSESVRIENLEQSIVDLLTVLEALVGVTSEELRRRLALNTAILLGSSEKAAGEIYRFLKTIYSLRNVVVHGRRTPREDIARELRKLFPRLSEDPEDDHASHLHYAESDLRALVRALLRAYVHMRTRRTRSAWPTDAELDDTMFSPGRRQTLRRQLGLARSVGPGSLLEYWPRFGPSTPA